MKYFYLLLSLIFCKFSWSQETNPLLVKGKRPFIDLSKVSDNAFEPNKISVKFKAAYRAQLSKGKINASKGIVQLDIPEMDRLNKAFKLKNASVLFLKSSNFKQQSLHEQWGFDLWYDLVFPEKTDVRKLMEAYQQSGLFEVVEPLYKIETTGIKSTQTFIPNDARFNDQWSLKNTGQAGGTIGKDIQATDAWDIEKGKPEVIVAMVDRGIEYYHPDLAQNMWSGIGYNFLTNNNVITPETHGTCTAGIVGAVGNNSLGISGIAGGNGQINSGIRLMSCQTFAGSVNGGFGEALIWAADHGACIASNSWVFTNANVYRISVLDAIDYFCKYGGGNALQGGIAIFAGGNNGEDRLTYPACYEKVIGVAATNNRDIKSSFSNYGDWVDISAPAGDGNGDGADILTTNIGGGYVYFSGSSACAPQIAGVAALIASKLSGKASASDVRNILLSTADDISSLNPNYINKLGSGRVNAFKALQKAQAFLTAYTTNAVASFTASIDCNNIALSWTKNTSNDDVIVAYNTNNNIGSPVNSTNYVVGNTLPGGGTVIYKGSLSKLNYAIPNDNIFQYFKIWSVTTTNQFSFGKQLELLTGPVYTISDNSSYTENIESPSFPTQSLRVSNPDNGITWGRTIDAKHEGTISAFMDNFNYTTVQQEDVLYLPLLKVHDVDSVKLSFWRAYQAAANADSLAIIVSTDCGKTFTTIWKKGGKDLATIPGSQNIVYIANSADWKKETITFGIPNSTEKVQIGFKAINGHGQNLYLDEIAVNTKTLPQKLRQKGLLISPNPFAKQFTIQHYLPPTDLKAISIFNMLGQRVLYLTFTANADANLIIDMSRFADGLYEVRLDYSNSSVAQKILKQTSF